MIKVVIAEDKPLILRSLKEKIQQHGPDIEVVGEALNGRDALDLILDKRPDLVFTDIRMPVMDGLQMIAEARRLQVNSEFIIISGHDEFEYARQAMKLGVQEYLLKPVQTDELNRLLERLCDDMTANKQTVQREALQAVIHSNGNDKMDISGLPDYPLYVALIMQAGPYSNFIIDYSNPFNGFWSSVDLREPLSGLLGDKEGFWCLEGKTFNEQVVVLGLHDADEERISQFASKLEGFVAAAGTPVTIVISEIIDRVEHLGIKSQFLRATLRKYGKFGKSSVLLQKDWSLFAEKDSPLLEPSLEKELVLLVRSGKKEAFLEEVRKLFHTWEKQACSQFDIEQMIKQLLRTCQKAVYGIAPMLGNLELEVDEIISISRDYHSLFQGLLYVFGAFFPKSEQQKQKGHPSMADIVGKVEAFLNENYQSPLTIHDIAKMVNFHPGYLGKVFKNVVGVSPMEYLTNLRIQKAKEWIRDNPDQSLKDIAELVGYSNPFYFSRIFKVATGMSPTEYKDELHK